MAPHTTPRSSSDSVVHCASTAGTCVQLHPSWPADCPSASALVRPFLLRYTAHVKIRVASLLLCLLATPAWALDYDRNDVVDRELSVGFGRASVDANLAAPVACADRRAYTCIANESVPSVFVIRGMARRHARFLYVGGGLELGMTLPVDSFPVHPWIGLGGVVGAETANTAWTPLRGYAELGVLAAWANTQISEIANGTLEVGARYQVSDRGRPHLQLAAGIRGMTNLSFIGVMGFLGAVWTFD